jgi:hypothetical protein
VHNEIDNLYDPNAIENQPVGLQIIGQQSEKEKVLGAAAVSEKLLVELAPITMSLDRILKDTTSLVI